MRMDVWQRFYIHFVAFVTSRIHVGGWMDGWMGGW